MEVGKRDDSDLVPSVVTYGHWLGLPAFWQSVNLYIVHCWVLMVDWLLATFVHHGKTGQPVETPFVTKDMSCY